MCVYVRMDLCDDDASAWPLVTLSAGRVMMTKRSVGGHWIWGSERGDVGFRLRVYEILFLKSISVVDIRRRT